MEWGPSGKLDQKKGDGPRRGNLEQQNLQIPEISPQNGLRCPTPGKFFWIPKHEENLSPTAWLYNRWTTKNFKTLKSKNIPYCLVSHPNRPEKRNLSLGTKSKLWNTTKSAAMESLASRLRETTTLSSRCQILCCWSPWKAQSMKNRMHTVSYFAKKL